MYRGSALEIEAVSFDFYRGLGVVNGDVLYSRSLVDIEEILPLCGSLVVVDAL